MYLKKSNEKILVEQIASVGHKKALNAFVRLIKEDKIAPEELSLRGLWEGLFGEIAPVGRMSEQYNKRMYTEAIVPTGFSAITSNTLVKAAIAEYDAAGGVGDSLVNNFPSKLLIDKVAGLTDFSLPDNRMPGEEYKSQEIEDRYVTAGYAQAGTIVDITEEAIFHDQTGILLMQAKSRLGTTVKTAIEKKIIEGIIDLNTSVYQPSGTATALYSSTNIQTGNALEDETDVTNAKNKLVSAMKMNDARGDNLPILMPNDYVLLCDTTLEDTAAKILYSNLNPALSNQGVNVWGPVLQATLKRRVQLASTTFLTPSGSHLATTWYFGAPKKQFYWKNVRPYSVFSIAGNPRKRIIQSMVADYAGDIFSTDTRFFVRNTVA